METKDRPWKGVRAPENVQSAIREMIADDEDLAAAAERLGLSPETMIRLGAGARVNRATVELARLRLGLAQEAS